MASPGVRKSGRQRQPSNRYSNGFVDISQIDGEGDTPPAEPDNDSDDEDAFDPDQIDHESPEADGQVSEVASDENDEPGQGNDDDDDDEEMNDVANDDNDDDDDPDERPAPSKFKKPRNAPSGKSKMGEVRLTEAMSVSRGVFDPRTKGSKGATKLYIYGPAPEDQEPAVQALYRWRKDVLLPSRKPDASGFGGYHRSFYHKDAERNREMNEEWTWYDQTFKERQKFDIIDRHTAEAYLPRSKPHVDVVLGPYGNQQSFRIPAGQTLNLNKPFPEASSHDQRNGWLLNVGERVQALSWMPNQNGPLQYLAVATMPIQYPAEAFLRGEKISAFEPQPSVKTAIQIWQFSVDDRGSVDLDKPPILRKAICTEWGHVRALRWCPAPRRPSPEPQGLIAGIWGDGTLRVLDVVLSDTPGPEYERVTDAAYTSDALPSVYTCLTWLSSHAVAAGTSTGDVSILDVTRSSPVMSCRMQSSYIASITSCYPSRPHMLATSSMSGYLSLTDLKRVSPITGFNPANTILSARSRLSKTVIAWHDWSQMLLCCDDNNALLGLALRKFYAHSGLARFPTAPSSLAVSEVHPHVAATSFGGQVCFVNPMRRVMNHKEGMFVLRWFQHEWRRTTMPDTRIVGLTENGYAAPAGDGQAYAKMDREDDGIARMVDGFKAEAVSLAKLLLNDKSRVGGVTTTIFETRTAATASAWNPNIHVGGWIAAGTAAGLVRVEDVGT